MAGAYEVTTVQRFTSDGVVGIWLFIGSPVLHAFGLWLIGDLFSFWTTFVTGVCMVGFLAGVVMLLIGREYVAYHRALS
jgi:hypothetical protein